MASTDIKEAVRTRYGAIASQGSSCCGASPQTKISKRVGYSESELEAVPDGANLGLGCGNPVALASLKEGETVLDLGSGAGFDCFLAAKQVGLSGKVIGVDMTPEMLTKARANAEKGSFKNVEFRKGEIENLPVADASVDVIISNCVINLSPEKEKVFREAHRVLKPGGRAYIADLVLLKPLPPALAKSVGLYAACVGGAMQREEYLATIRAAGFKDVKIASEVAYPLDSFACDSNITDSGLFKELKDIPVGELIEAAKSVVSIKVEITKSPTERLSCCGG